MLVAGSLNVDIGRLYLRLPLLRVGNQDAAVAVLAHDICLHLEPDHRCGDENQQRENDKGVRSVESKFDVPHTVL